MTSLSRWRKLHLSVRGTTHVQPRPTTTLLRATMISGQRLTADVTSGCVGGSATRRGACALATLLAAIGRRTWRACVTTGNGYSVAIIASLLVQIFSGCDGGQFDGQCYPAFSRVAFVRELLMPNKKNKNSCLCKNVTSCPTMCHTKLRCLLVF